MGNGEGREGSAMIGLRDERMRIGKREIKEDRKKDGAKKARMGKRTRRRKKGK